VRNSSIQDINFILYNTVQRCRHRHTQTQTQESASESSILQYYESDINMHIRFYLSYSLSCLYLSFMSSLIPYIYVLYLQASRLKDENALLLNELNKVRADMLAKVKQFAEVIEKCEQLTAAPGALDKLDLAGCEELERQLKVTMEAVDNRKVSPDYDPAVYMLLSSWRSYLDISYLLRIPFIYALYYMSACMYVRMNLHYSCPRHCHCHCSTECVTPRRDRPAERTTTVCGVSGEREVRRTAAL
jgi:hypothetical protein